MFLQDKYNKFSYSQLCELLSVSDMKIICMDDENTSSALDTGYCVIALQEV